MTTAEALETIRRDQAARVAACEQRVGEVRADSGCTLAAIPFIDNDGRSGARVAIRPDPRAKETEQ